MFGIVLVIGLCAVGGFGALGLGMFSAGSAAATSEAATALAVAAAQQTQQAQDSQLATQIAIEQAATALALSEPINQAAQWPVAYADDFGSDLKNWSTGNLSGSRSTGQRQIAGGVYQWTVKALGDLNLRTTLGAIDDVGDFYYVVDAMQTSGPSTADYGLVYRIVSDRSFYYFAITNNGQYSVYKLQNNSWSVLVDYTDSPAINPGGANRLAVVGDGSDFTFYINDVHVADHQDDSFARGKVGIAIQLFANEQAKFEFDNVELHTP